MRWGPTPSAGARASRSRLKAVARSRAATSRRARAAGAYQCDPRGPWRRLNACVCGYNQQHMSLRDIRRHIGQLAIAGFAGDAIPSDLRSLAREFDLGGIILFARNVVAPDQVADLSREAQTMAQELPFWVSVDQEGGRVARLKAPFTVWPPMMTLGRSGDEALAERFARALAAELKAVGISLDYTPVLDINTNPKNPVIGDRALAERAEDVARLGRRIITTLQGAGIAACGKHFPGPWRHERGLASRDAARRACARPARCRSSSCRSVRRSRRASPRS